jgi:putative heme-binding domain-containing protein
LLIVGYDGTIHQLVANVAAKANQDFPLKLSQTGLFSSVKDHDVAPGVTAYRINAEPWADHTLADRYIALPGTSQLGIHKSSNAQVGNLKGEWSFPTDSVLMKTISLEMEVGNPRSQRRLETQILHRDGDTWRAYSYIWKDDQTDAVLSPGQGLDRTFTVADPRVPGGRRNQVWHFASRTECILCHTTRAGTVHGFRIDQLNNSDQGNDDGLDQLNLLSELNLFSEPLFAGKPRNKWPRIVSPSDESADINLRARAYLHVNCAHCHRRGGGGTAAIDVQFQHSIEKTNLLNARPTQGTFGVHRAGVVAAGAPHRSVLFIRMAKLGRGRMPYFGSSMVDEAGLQLIHDWIQQLPIDGNGQTAATAETTSRRLLQQLRTSSKQSADSRAKLIGQLLSSTSSAMLLLAATGELTDPLEKELKKTVIAIAAKHQNVEIRDLFERFVAEEHRVKRLGSVIDPKRILAIVGDRRRGKRLFETTSGVQCRNCHRIGTIGQQVGPDLSLIGKKYKRFQILENLLEPSKQIDEKFITYLVETTDGRVITGLLVEKNENKVVLKNATNKLVEISRKDIDVFVPTRKSLMPDLLLREMTAQQVADLLEFFSSLK